MRASEQHCYQNTNCIWWLAVEFTLSSFYNYFSRVLCCMFFLQLVGGGSPVDRLSVISSEEGGWWYHSSRWMGDKLGLMVEEMPFTSPPPPLSALTIMLLAEHNQYTHLLFQPLHCLSSLSFPLVDAIFCWCSLIHFNSIPASPTVPGVLRKKWNFFP